MRLLLLRHGIAISREHPSAPLEAERFLTPTGRKKTRAAMRGLARLLSDSPLVWSSPYLRAQQTAQLFAAAMGLSSDVISVTDALLPEADPRSLMRELGRQRETPVVVCVGHRPHLDRMLQHALVGAPVRGLALKKAGAALLEVTAARKGGSSLEWLVTPQLLRAVGRR